MSKNEQAIKEFCEQFSPQLRYVRTERVNGQRVPDAYMAAYWDQERGIGTTATAIGGQVRAYIEIARPGDTGAEIGQIVAAALGLVHGGNNGQS